MHTNLPPGREYKVAFGEGGTPERVRNVSRPWKRVQRVLHSTHMDDVDPVDFAKLPQAERDKVERAAGCFFGGHVAGGVLHPEARIVRSIVTFESDGCTNEQARAVLYGEAWDGRLAYFSYAMRPYGDGFARIRIAVPLARDHQPGEYVELVTDMARDVKSSLGLTVDPASFCPAHRLWLPSSWAGRAPFRAIVIGTGAAPAVH